MRGCLPAAERPRQATTPQRQVVTWLKRREERLAGPNGPESGVVARCNVTTRPVAAEAATSPHPDTLAPPCLPALATWPLARLACRPGSPHSDVLAPWPFAITAINAFYPPWLPPGRHLRICTRPPPCPARVSDQVRHPAPAPCPAPVHPLDMTEHEPRAHCENDVAAGSAAVCRVAGRGVAGAGCAWWQCRLAAKGVLRIGMVPRHPVTRQPRGQPGSLAGNNGHDGLTGTLRRCPDQGCGYGSSRD